MISNPWLKPFYLSVIVFSLLISRTFVTSALQDDNETSSSFNDSDVNEAASISSESNSLGEFIEEDENTGDDSAGAKFNWDHHSEDHSIYSGRSLISAKDINPIQEHDDDVLLFRDPKAMDKSDELKKSKLNDESLNPLKTYDYAEKEWQLMFRSLDLAYESMSSSMIQELGKHTNLFEEIVSNVKPECRREINHIRNSAKQHRLWALRMLDSNGKLPSGVTYGRFASPGDYEECLSVRVDEYLSMPKAIKSTNKNDVWNQLEHHKFHGKYCLIDFRLPLPERPRDKLMSIHEPVLNLTGSKLAEQFPEIKNYSAYASVFYEIGYLHAFCLPSTCDIVDITQSLSKALEGIHVIVNNTIDCQEISETPVALRKSQIISLVILSIVFLNAILASFAHHLQTSGKVKAADNRQANKDSSLENHQGKIKQSNLEHHNEAGQFKPAAQLSSSILENKFYSDCFSIQKNFERLTKPDPRGLAFVHYTRIVAMALTVITHTAALGTLQAITKPADASNSEQIFRDFIPQMLANAFTSIQIFFFMAGFMLVISTYPSIRRDKGHLSFVEFAIKRGIRLMPGLVAAICINFLWPIFVDGPMLTYFIRMIVVPCESNWWRTLGFVSNFDHVEKMCLRHSYFSASDYQLHLMAYPMLILLYKQPTLALIIAGILTIAGFIAQVIMVLTKTLMPFMMVDYIDKEAFFNVVHYIHHPVWNHVSAFFYGFIIGYMVVRQIRIRMRPETIKRIWCILLPIGIASIFAPYFWNHYKRPIYRWQMVIYVIVDRFILLSTCAWISYATMVLAKKPLEAGAKSSPKSVENRDQVDIKSSNIMGQPDMPHIDQPDAFNDGNHQVVPPVEPTDQSDGSKLKAIGSQGSITRQRSSPNIHRLQEEPNQMVAPRSFSRTVSSVDLFKTMSGQAKNSEKIDTGENQSTVTAEVAAGREQTIKKDNARSRPQVSNVNTLCLILSRLTFQLYLFNMIVLWIDVNHSKYFWFFSYYFIIMKSFGVYVASAIFSVVFFVTMESPSLTLYISWVKSRAGARVGKQQARDNPDAPTRRPAEQHSGKTINEHPMQGKLSSSVGAIDQMSSTLNPVSFSARSNTISGGTAVERGFDGLCMKSGHMGPDSPPFTFIDLSSPGGATFDTLNANRIEENSKDQTRM